MKKSKKKPQSSSGTNLRPITLKLPVAYMEILEAEAERIGVRRGAFLTLLLQRKRGELQLERSAVAPKYKFTDAQLRKTQMWTWYLQPQYYALLEADRLQMGLTSMTAWITQTINQWIGKPGGLRS